MFMTPDELKTLTGYELPAWQMRWLKSHGYQFEQAASGRPVVLRSHVINKLSGDSKQSEWVPNVAAIRKVA